MRLLLIGKIVAERCLAVLTINQPPEFGSDPAAAIAHVTGLWLPRVKDYAKHRTTRWRSSGDGVDEPRASARILESMRQALARMAVGYEAPP